MCKRSVPVRPLAVGLALAVSLGLAGPAPAQDARLEAARKEGKVVWYTSLALPSAERVARMFEAAHPGVTVEVHRTGSQRVLQRVMQELKANIRNVDVIHTSDAGHFVFLKAQKLLARYTPAGVERFLPGFTDPDGYHFGLRATVNVIAYNTKAVPAAEAPQGWKDLLDPRWRGKLVTAHPGYSGIIATHVLALVHLHGWDYFRQLALWPHMTVAQNVAYGLRFKRELTRAERERRVREMLAVVQLAGYERRYPGELSGGQQQRVAVARALVVEPEILLLDEPLSNLDATLREEMRFEIRRLHEAFGITTLYVTHDQAEAMVISDRIAVLQHGRVVQLGTADELFHRPRTRFVAAFIGRTNVVEGVAVAPDTMARGALRLRVAAADLKPGAPVAVSVRPHRIELAADGGPAEPGVNVLAGTLQRASFLGDSVDCQVQVADTDVVLRVAAPATLRARTGETVGLRIDPAACVPLSER